MQLPILITVDHRVLIFILNTSVSSHIKLSGKKKYANYVKQFLGSFAKLLQATTSYVMSVYMPVCPHVTTWLPPNAFL